jgi:predicted nuclease of predicted toxin-antitoxin system
MLLYADENFYRPVTVRLRALGHDVLTVQDDGLAGEPDPVVLARAHALGRVILTLDRRDYERLHRGGVAHSGILSVTHDTDFDALAARVDAALNGLTPGSWCLRVNRPPGSP